MNVFEVRVRKKTWTEAGFKTRTFAEEVSFPSELDEITMKMWSDYFLTKDEHDPDWVKAIEKLPATEQMEQMGQWSDHQWSEYYSLVLKYLGCFTTSPLEVLSQAPLHDPDGLMAIYFHIVGLINNYEPQLMESFQFKGDTYVIDPVEVDRFGRTLYGKSLTANQVIDSLQYEHVFNVKDNNGNYAIRDRRYQIDLALVALLTEKVLPDGSLEKRPLDYVERQNWTEAKILSFLDVPMSIALNVDFFLRSSKMRSLSTLTQERFLRHGKSRPTPRR